METSDSSRDSEEAILESLKTLNIFGCHNTEEIFEILEKLLNYLTQYPSNNIILIRCLDVLISYYQHSGTLSSIVYPLDDQHIRTLYELFLLYQDDYEITVYICKLLSMICKNYPFELFTNAIEDGLLDNLLQNCEKYLEFEFHNLQKVTGDPTHEESPCHSDFPTIGKNMSIASSITTIPLRNESDTIFSYTMEYSIEMIKKMSIDSLQSFVELSFDRICIINERKCQITCRSMNDPIEEEDFIVQILTSLTQRYCELSQWQSDFDIMLRYMLQLFESHIADYKTAVIECLSYLYDSNHDDLLKKLIELSYDSQTEKYLILQYLSHYIRDMSIANAVESGEWVGFIISIFEYLIYNVDTIIRLDDHDSSSGRDGHDEPTEGNNELIEQHIKDSLLRQLIYITDDHFRAIVHHSGNTELHERYMELLNIYRDIAPQAQVGIASLSSSPSSIDEEDLQLRLDGDLIDPIGEVVESITPFSQSPTTPRKEQQQQQEWQGESDSESPFVKETVEEQSQIEEEGEAPLAIAVNVEATEMDDLNTPASSASSAAASNVSEETLSLAAATSIATPADPIEIGDIAVEEEECSPVSAAANDDLIKGERQQPVAAEIPSAIVEEASPVTAVEPSECMEQSIEKPIEKLQLKVNRRILPTEETPHHTAQAMAAGTHQQQQQQQSEQVNSISTPHEAEKNKSYEQSVDMETLQFLIELNRKSQEQAEAAIYRAETYERLFKQAMAKVEKLQHHIHELHEQQQQSMNSFPVESSTQTFHIAPLSLEIEDLKIDTTEEGETHQDSTLLDESAVISGIIEGFKYFVSLKQAKSPVKASSSYQAMRLLQDGVSSYIQHIDMDPLQQLASRISEYFSIFKSQSQYSIRLSIISVGELRYAIKTMRLTENLTNHHIDLMLSHLNTKLISERVFAFVLITCVLLASKGRHLTANEAVERLEEVLDEYEAIHHGKIFLRTESPRLSHDEEDKKIHAVLSQETKALRLLFDSYVMKLSKNNSSISPSKKALTTHLQNIIYYEEFLQFTKDFEIYPQLLTNNEMKTIWHDVCLRGDKNETHFDSSYLNFIQFQECIKRMGMRCSFYEGDKSTRTVRVLRFLNWLQNSKGRDILAVRYRGVAMPLFRFQNEDIRNYI